MTLRNHEGLKRVRLPDDRVQYIKGLIASPLSSQNQGLDQATYDRLKRHTMRLCGISLDDPNIAAKRQEAINARIRQQEEEESQRMAQVFQRFQQQALGQIPVQGSVQQQQFHHFRMYRHQISFSNQRLQRHTLKCSLALLLIPVYHPIYESC